MLSKNGIRCSVPLRIYLANCKNLTFQNFINLAIHKLQKQLQHTGAPGFEGFHTR